MDALNDNPIKGGWNNFMNKIFHKIITTERNIVKCFRRNYLEMGTQWSELFQIFIT